MSLCLNMIVKNEAHIITKTFDNLLETFTFDYYVICDTGSTDNTIETISSYFATKNIRGEIPSHEWKNFGHNRTLALQAAHGKSDYLLIFDADDSIVGNLRAALPKKLTADKYQLIFGPGISYTRPLIINNRKHWKFVGVLHEYLTSVAPCKETDVIVQGDYNIISGRAGARSKNINKYADDAEILRAAIIEEPDEMLQRRYKFYCAQSYRDAGQQDNAIIWYSQCVQSEKSWAQERWVSCNELGKLSLAKGQLSTAIDYFLRTTLYDPERIEGILTAVQLLMKQQNYYFIEALYDKYAHYNKNPINKLFISLESYNQNIFEGYYTCALLNIYKYKEGFTCALKILNSPAKTNKAILELMLHHCGKYIMHAGNYSETIFDRFSELLEEMPYSVNNTASWHDLYKHEHSRITRYNPKQFPIAKKCKKNGIILTFTTCKRFDLFKQTINSIINFWGDINLINYWFCVDDNSSEADRRSMQLCYPWIEYYNKTLTESGHRESMNIIYKKLQTMKSCRYWIHMEDDFVFYKKMNYVELGIAGFSAFPGQNVKQVLFNKNYAETVDEYKCVSSGQLSPDNNYLLHNHSNNIIAGPNHEYWPGYSLRPSITLIEAVKSLNDYTSPNVFFERDYANKWHAAGYKCAFFNKITSRHIGKLTNEHGNNAYALNNTEQFQSIAKNAIKDISMNKIKTKVINLLRRPDRKAKMIDILAKESFANYDIVAATDLNAQPSLFSIKFLSKLFYGNDFANRTGVIGCALSHFFLWNQLLNDNDTSHYLIFEDDITLRPNCGNIIPPHFNFDFLFLGYLDNNPQKRTECETPLTESSGVIPLNSENYIGGFHAYIITKSGAKKILNYIKCNGIKHGIDYLIKICPGLICYAYNPLLVSVDWTPGQICADTDIQNSFSIIKLEEGIIKLEEGTMVSSKKNILTDSPGIYKYEFIQGLDIIGNDLFYKKINNNDCIEDAKTTASNIKDCAGFNSLGFYKSKIDITELRESPYFSKSDGIYIKIVL